MNKPIAFYKPSQWDIIEEDMPALVDVTSHPTLVRDNNIPKLARTSLVIRVGTDGEFETLNTIYKPVQPDLLAPVVQ